MLISADLFIMNWAWGIGHGAIQFWILDFRFWIRVKSKIRLEKFGAPASGDLNFSQNLKSKIPSP